MNTKKKEFLRVVPSAARRGIIGAILALPLLFAFEGNLSAAAPAAAPKQETFSSPKAAAEALITAAARFDVPALAKILGPDGINLVTSKDAVQDRNQAGAFARRALEKHEIVPDKKHPGRMILVIGDEDYPSPIPIVKAAKGWRFDSKAGAQEILYRRIGHNELDAIQICEGYVEAQREYAETKHDGSRVNQYAQHIIATPGEQNGLAWRTADGKWEGPIGENVANAIAEGYSDKVKPYHGYFFKVLKGQGPAAHLGQLDFVVEGAMIGGFALVAFKALELYNPDKTWKAVPAD